MYTHAPIAQLPTEARARYLRSPTSGVTSTYDLPNMGVGNQNWVGASAHNH